MIKPVVYKAERMNVKASIQIEGLTGTGKTGLALALAYSLAGKAWDKVGFNDTENRSSNLYVGIPLHTGVKVEQFQKTDLESKDGFAPENYIACTDALIKSGATVVVHDSITHAWQRVGGVLDMVNEVEGSGNKNAYTAWGDPKVRKNKDLLFDMLRDNRCHVITTVRVKEKYGLELDPTTGKNKVISLGEQQQTQDGIKYEPDLVLHMVEPGTKDRAPIARIIKTRYPMFEKDQEYEFTAEIIDSIKEYLEQGTDPAVLIERQLQSYRDEIIKICKADPVKKVIYDNNKKQMGLASTKINDLSLVELKQLYSVIT